jgi:hypothetical protein
MNAESTLGKSASGGIITDNQPSITSVDSSEPSAGADLIALDRSSAMVPAVREVAIKKGLPNFDKKRRIADLIASELKSLGEFYHTHDDRLWFLPNSERQLMELESRQFARMLTHISGLGKSEAFFGFALDSLAVLADRTPAREVHTLSHYNEATGLLAVSDGGRGVWVRERGGHWQHALNGNNGIVFRTDPDADPWDPEISSKSDSGELEHLDWFMNQFPFIFCDDVFPDAQRALLRMSLLQRFFPPLARTNLIPTFLGPPGSGKSTAQRLIGCLLVGPRFQLSDLKGENYDGFVAAITNRLVHGVDNIDARVGWFPDAIARYATGISFTKRRPYSLNEPVSHSPTAWLTLSSCNPYFTRADIADRLLPMHFGRLENFRPESAIFGELRQRRNLIMGDLLRTLGITADRLAETSHINGKTRMADFASFWQRSAHTDASMRGHLGSLRRLQREFATDCDDLIEVLRLLLEASWPKGIPFTPIAELYERCHKIAQYGRLSLPSTLQGFGRRLSNQKLNIESELSIKFKAIRGHRNERKIQLQLIGSAWKNPSLPISLVVKRVKQEMQIQAGDRIQWDYFLK